MKQIQDSLLARYKARKAKYGYGGGMNQDWTAIKNYAATAEDEELDGLPNDDGSGVTRGQVGKAANAIGSALNATSDFGTGSYNEYRRSISAPVGAAMNVVGNLGPVGGVVSGVYGAANSIAKPIRNNAEATNYGQLTNPKAAGRTAVIGGIFDGGSALSYRIKNNDWGIGTKKYVAKLNEEAYKEYDATYGVEKRRRQLERDARAGQQGLYQSGSASQYYKNGGSLLDNFKRTSASTVEVEGPSHQAGGVPVPGMNAEVEGGETIAGDYVFSKELGFADLHKPIARAKGKVEKKPATRERMNTLKLLNEKENKLKLYQELVKAKQNLQ